MGGKKRFHPRAGLRGGDTAAEGGGFGIQPGAYRRAARRVPDQRLDLGQGVEVGICLLYTSDAAD
ncbi:hypothetical protein, partial [Sediminimonas sp.]|uniref:hypothetical protein n=1 Tax=Sediminimonas sp. TaxID=2823379 RepID=UPI0025DF48FA